MERVRSPLKRDLKGERTDPIGPVRWQIDRSKINLPWGEPRNEVAMHASKAPSPRFAALDGAECAVFSVRSRLRMNYHSYHSHFSHFPSLKRFRNWRRPKRHFLWSWMMPSTPVNKRTYLP